MDKFVKKEHSGLYDHVLGKWLTYLSIILFSLSISPARAQIGSWKNYLAYHSVQDICEADHDLFIQASNSLYQYNKNDMSIITYDKVNGLSDIIIRHIAWNKQVKRLIIVYENSNIDLLDVNGNVVNISALYSKNMTEDKTVSSVRIDGIYAWLICGFGIVKVNMQKAEIMDTYTENNPDYPTNLPEEDHSAYDKYHIIVSALSPGGPKYNHFFNMMVHNGQLYIVGGGVSQFMNFNRPGTIQVLDQQGNWTIFEDNIKPAFASSYMDVNAIAIDPLNENHVMVASNAGVYEFLNGKFQKNYTHGNTSYFESAASNGSPDYVRTNGILFDRQGKMYCLNSASSTAIIMRSSDGQWSGFMDEALEDKPGKALRAMKGSFLDSQGRIWFCNAHTERPALVCFYPSQEQVIVYENFVNQDGAKLAVNSAFCAAEDVEGNIWIGTNIGPVYLAKNDIGNANSTFTQHKVPRNDGTDYADYLLANVNISCMAIDKANRKWFGTPGNGVYLISSDNNTEVSHFITTNSKLLSNTIESVAINDETGEVFFGTEAGLCSYISDATATNEEMTKDNVWAYPNPVTPDYTGLITIVGLSYDADVKILSSNGAIIAEGRSNGGSFTWDGKDKSGNRVASGVYMVAAATSKGEKGTVCKIAVVR